MRGGEGDLPARALSSVASVVHLPRRGGGGLQRGDRGGTRRSRRLRQPLVQPRARHRLLRRGVGVGAARVGLGARERHQCAGRATVAVAASAGAGGGAAPSTGTRAVAGENGAPTAAAAAAAAAAADAHDDDFSTNVVWTAHSVERRCACTLACCSA